MGMANQHKLVDRNCEFCGKHFQPRLSDVNIGRGRCCSHSCRGQNRRKIHRPSQIRGAVGSKGGHARAASLTTARRSEIARNAGKARWEKRHKERGRPISLYPLKLDEIVKAMVNTPPLKMSHAEAGRRGGLMKAKRNKQTHRLPFTPPPGIEEAMNDKFKAYEYIQKWRWPNGVFCLKCGETYVNKRLLRKLLTFECRNCLYCFTSIAKTAFHHSKDIGNILKVIYYIRENPSISISELCRKIGRYESTVKILLRRLRVHPFIKDRSPEWRKNQSRIQKARWELLHGPKQPKPFKPGGRLPKQTISLLNLRPYTGYK